MTTHSLIPELNANIHGKISDIEQSGDLYKITVNDDIIGEKVIFTVPSDRAKEILENRNATFRFLGEMRCDFNTKTNKTTNIDFKMADFQVLDDTPITESIDNIRRKIRLPDNIIDKLLKDRQEQ